RRFCGRYGRFGGRRLRISHVAYRYGTRADVRSATLTSRVRTPPPSSSAVAAVPAPRRTPPAVRARVDRRGGRRRHSRLSPVEWSRLDRRVPERVDDSERDGAGRPDGVGRCEAVRGGLRAVQRAGVHRHRRPRAGAVDAPALSPAAHRGSLTIARINTKPTKDTKEDGRTLRLPAWCAAGRPATPAAHAFTRAANPQNRKW